MQAASSLVGEDANICFFADAATNLEQKVGVKFLLISGLAKRHGD